MPIPEWTSNGKCDAARAATPEAQTLVLPLYTEEQARDWFTSAQNAISKGQCWRCGAQFADPRNAALEWTWHQPIEGSPRSHALSCSPGTGAVYDAIYQRHLR